LTATIYPYDYYNNYEYDVYDIAYNVSSKLSMWSDDLDTYVGRDPSLYGASVRCVFGELGREEEPSDNIDGNAAGQNIDSQSRTSAVVESGYMIEEENANNGDSEENNGRVVDDQKEEVLEPLGKQNKAEKGDDSESVMAVLVIVVGVAIVSGLAFAIVMVAKGRKEG